MIRELKGTYSYPKVMLLLSVLTFIFGVATNLLGEIFLPFSSALFAALLLFEEPKKRIFSYIVPVLTLAVAVITDGLYGLMSIQYVVIALIIFFSYICSATKAECSVYISITVAVFLILSLYLDAAKEIGSFAFADISKYYLNVYTELKDAFIKLLTDYSVTLEDGTKEHLISPDIAELYFESFANLIVSIIGIFAFCVSGVAIKVFTKIALRYSNNGILKTFAHFIPSRLAAFAYIALAVISMFVTKINVFNLAIINSSNILMVAFAYIGVQYVLLTGKISNRRSSVYTLLVAAMLLMPGISLQILSYLGVWLTLGAINPNHAI